MDTNIKVSHYLFIYLFIYYTLLQLWDVRRKGCLYTYKGHTEVINGIQFSPDGKWLVSASSDNAVRVSKREEKGRNIVMSFLYSLVVGS